MEAVAGSLIERTAEAVWLPAYLDDVESDLSAFHRIDDMYALDGPTLLRLAIRLPAYEGVLRARAMAEAADEEKASPASRAPQARQPGGGMQYDAPDTITPATVAQDPVLASLISFGTG